MFLAVFTLPLKFLGWGRYPTLGAWHQVGLNTFYIITDPLGVKSLDKEKIDGRNVSMKMIAVRVLIVVAIVAGLVFRSVWVTIACLAVGLSSIHYSKV